MNEIKDEGSAVKVSHRQSLEKILSTLRSIRAILSHVDAEGPVEGIWPLVESTAEFSDALGYVHPPLQRIILCSSPDLVKNAQQEHSDRWERVWLKYVEENELFVILHLFPPVHGDHRPLRTWTLEKWRTTERPANTLNALDRIQSVPSLPMGWEQFPRILIPLASSEAYVQTGVGPLPLWPQRRAYLQTHIRRWEAVLAGESEFSDGTQASARFQRLSAASNPVWRIIFQNEEGEFRNNACDRLYRLIVESREGHWISAINLMNGTPDPSAAEHSYDTNTDAEAANAYRKSLRSVDRRLEENPGDQKAQAEKDSLMKELHQMNARKGKPRLGNTITKTARHAVSVGFVRLFTEMERRGMKATAQHFRRAVQNDGSDFCYCAPLGTTWQA